jgi:tetratricopeptide (TPR) repeat protein
VAAVVRIALMTMFLLATGCGAARMVGIGTRPGDGAGSKQAPAAGTTSRAEPKAAKKEKKSKPSADEHARSIAADPLDEARARAAAEPNEPWWPYRVAELEARGGRREASEAALKDALAREPGYAPALTSISRLLYQQGRHAEAVTLLAPVRDGSIVLDEDDRAAAIAGLALHEVALGNDDRARAALGELEKSGRTGALAVSAFLAVRGTDAGSALERTEAAVQAAPKSAANHNNRGIALLRSGDPEGAEKEFAKAIELDPRLPGPYYNLAILERWYRMDHDQATHRFQQYWLLSHDDPDSLQVELLRGKPAPVAEDGDPR